jgi:hypothetical protein
MLRIQGMTELVNGTFIGDLSTLLSSCAEGKNIFFEIDKEFESMMVIVKSNFVRVDSFLLSMWVSLPLRQSLIHKLVDVKSTDQATRIKTEGLVEDHIAGLLNDDPSEKNSNYLPGQ